MELIKIEAPCTELMENTLTEEECDKLFEQIQSVLNSDESMTKALRESNLAVPIIAGGSVAVIALISAINKWIKNKYTLHVSKLVDQSKELNDLYTKVEDLIKHDKMARFRHRNDPLNIDGKVVVMVDKKDAKVYQITNDFIGYDPDFFINQINDIMASVAQSKDKEADINVMKDSLLQKIEKGFMERHGFVETCTPMIKTTTYRGVKLENAIMYQKQVIGGYYNNIYVLNHSTKEELQYMQILQQAYNKMISVYGKDKNGKVLVDDIFKKLLQNISKSMDFNSRVMFLFEEAMKFYVTELQKIYDILRS